jgi:hypothetical protein
VNAAATPFGTTRTRSGGTPTTAFTSRAVNSETAITRVAARIIWGTTRGA